MLTRFSSRFVSTGNQRFAAATSASASTWVSRRYAGEKAAPEAEAADEKKPAGTEEEKKIEDSHTKHKKLIVELEVKVKELEEDNSELKKDLLYNAAELDNARRIAREDLEKARNFSVTSFGKDMLEVADTMARAIEALAKLPAELVAEHKALANVLTGVKMADAVLSSAFNKHNITTSECTVGAVFDPNLHEALFNAPATDDIPAGHITCIVKGGYTIKDRVLRAAQVGVAEAQK
jgi:molecular chaperone GrpE